jgi:hypothetical protein
MNELTERLATGDHPVTVGGPQPSLEDLKNRIDEIGWVHIKFTGTRGGTDLGIRLDTEATDLSKADFEKGSGTIHVEGNLTLNDDPVRLFADIDLATLNGTGHLEPRDVAAESAATAEETPASEEAAVSA